MLSICLLVLVFSTSIIATNVTGSVAVVLSWNGAQSCRQESCGTGQLLPAEYACSDGSQGDWMSGIKTFSDPLPKDGEYQVESVEIQFTGAFYCEGLAAPQASFVAELATTTITFDELPNIPQETCNCSMCFAQSPIYSDGGSVKYSGYNYGGENNFLLGVITNTICLSAVQLTLYYSGILIELTELSPNRGPVSGGTSVSVKGEGFPNSTSWLCQFGSQVVGATWVDDDEILCLTPKSEIGAGNVTVRITYSDREWIGGGIFTYFDPTDPGGVASFAQVLEAYWWIWLIVVFFLGCIVVSCILARRKGTALDKESLEPLLGEMSSGNTPLIPEVLDIEEIELTRTVGRGNFGEVFQGNWRGIEVAVKKVKLSLEGNEEVIRDFEREADIMRFLRHPNIVQYLGLSKHQEELCIVTEFMEKGSLWAILHRQKIDLDYNLKLNIAQDICKGMNYLHKCEPSVIHRDLKTHNLLVDSSWKVKVGDFGLAKLIKLSEIESSHMTACGTPAYTAPEVLRNSHYTSKADVYSFGVVLWEIISEEEPHKGVPPFQVVFAVGTQGVRPSIPDSCDVTIRRIIEDSWTENPKIRPTFGQLLERFQEIPPEPKKDPINL